MKEQILELERISDKNRAKITASFFKTAKGEYGEGDKFLGVSNPDIRKTCKKYPVENLKEIEKMLQNEFHEIRFAALVNLISLYKRSDSKQKKKIFNFYIKNSKRINNWDFVDISAPHIIGDYLLKNKNERKILYILADSKNIWQRRIAILSTFPLIKNNDFKDLQKISLILLQDKHDLIHKAVGWMLREAGKIDKSFLINFLNKNSQKMPRTMLRYSIEKLSDKERKKYLL